MTKNPSNPLHSQNIALFLDVDGTLLEIAPTPEAAEVSMELRKTLQAAWHHSQGAMALISGRSLQALDRLFAPDVFPAAGKHGSERRDASGRIWCAPVDSAPLQTIRAELGKLTASHPQLLLEDKDTALALHYRAAPELERHVREALEAAAREFPQYQIKPGKCVFELAPAGYTKGTAIQAFMREAPFSGRMPVFIGDDVTDEDGFAVVNELHGHSIRVGEQGTSAARYRLSNVAAVIAWLRERYEIRPEAITK